MGHVDMRNETLVGKSVLLVEDHPLEAIDYRDRLRSVGADIVGPVSSVRAALACIWRNRIDIAVLDYALTDGNSEKLQDALEHRNIPYVILSGFPSVLVRRSMQQAILAKPVPPDLLSETLSEIYAARHDAAE